MNNQVIKLVSLEDSQVRLPLQLAQSDAENYMISITHHKQKFSFPKLTTSILNNRLLLWLEGNELIADEQNGFR